MNTIAEKIVSQRKELNMTQKELAEKLEISDKTVSRWETGKQIPDALAMPEIAKVLEISIGELYGEKKKEDFKKEDNEQSHCEKYIDEKNLGQQIGNEEYAENEQEKILEYKKRIKLTGILAIVGVVAIFIVFFGFGFFSHSSSIQLLRMTITYFIMLFMWGDLAFFIGTLVDYRLYIKKRGK